MKKIRYVAYDAANSDYEWFETVEEAKKWLTHDDGDGISEEACNGQNFISEIQYRSVVTKIEDRDDYCKCENMEDEECVCNKQAWEHSEDFSWIGVHDYEKIEYNN